MFKKIAAATVLMIASATTFAAQPNTFYAGGDVGRTKSDFIPDRDTSVGAFVGYNIDQTFAVEAGYRRLLDRDYQWPDIRANTRVNQASLSLVASMPVGESFSVYGRLGAARLQNRFTSNEFVGKLSTTKALYGIGAGYAFSPAVSARIEVQKAENEATNLSTGLSFQF
ncbi:porin family protein [Massilia consociata]|uniref:Porin family protein n=1 Tax=Massilia consociata TaxID=760117 RepID=A0ABV6FF21_9BURK